MTLFKQGRIFVAYEILRCPRCGKPHRLAIYSDTPEKEWKICRGCGYKALLNFIPILDKYGISHRLSKSEKQEITKHLKSNIKKI